MATEQVPKGGCEPHGKRDTTVPELDLDKLPKELNLGTFKKSKVSFFHSLPIGDEATSADTISQFTMIFDDTDEVLDSIRPKVAILAGMEVSPPHSVKTYDTDYPGTRMYIAYSTLPPSIWNISLYLSRRDNFLSSSRNHICYREDEAGRGNYNYLRSNLDGICR